MKAMCNHYISKSSLISCRYKGKNFITIFALAICFDFTLKVQLEE